MLITNFASGELSETLFGRIDLPQYYQGVSRLENFDVIPTGGIIRRNGTVRLSKLEREGRIIPFIIDREQHYLLYLTPEERDDEDAVVTPARITIYLNGKQQGDPIDDSEAVPLFKELSEIKEVQHAQTYKIMILVHQNYKPLKITYMEEGLFVDVINITYMIETKADEDIEYVPEQDTAYEKNQYLLSEGNYPGAVTFFNSRLVFARTFNNRQRIFASKTNDIFSFGTYKRFITEQRKYIAVSGTAVQNDDPDTFTMELDSMEASKFVEPLENYFTGTSVFDRDTKIVSLTGNFLKLSKSPNIIISLTADEKASLNLVASRYAQYNASPVSSEIVALFTRLPSQPVNLQALLNVYSSYIMIYAYTLPAPVYVYPSKYYYYPSNLAKLIEDNPNYVRNFINNAIADYINFTYSYTFFVLTWRAGSSVLNQIATASTNLINQTMKWYYPTGDHTYYNFGDAIKREVDAQMEAASRLYIPFYTKETIVDRYPTPDDGFTFEISSDINDAIQWMGQNKHLVVGTETGEWIIPAETNAANARAILNSRYGSDRIQGTAIGDAFCFVQTGRKSLVEYYIPQQDTNFRANNMALLSKNMLHESPAYDVDFVSAPYTKIFISREDGIVVSLLYERGTGTFAWSRFMTKGLIKSVASLPGMNGYDEVYLVVIRDDGIFLERLDERRHVFLDSYEAWTGFNEHFSGGAVVYDDDSGISYAKGSAPLPITGHHMWIGFPFVSRVRSMPVIANQEMKQSAVKVLQTRFHDSFMPKVRSEPNGVENTIPSRGGNPREGYTGIVQIPFPGIYDKDVFFEFIHDEPNRCEILAVNAEAN